MNLIIRIKLIAQHELINGSFYIFIGGLISSILAFLLNIYFARTLSYQDYGSYSALISIIGLLIVPSASISAVITRYATMFFANQQPERAGAFYVGIFKGLFIFCFLLIVIMLLLSSFILDFLKINQIGLLFISVLSVSIIYLSTLNMAFIQSLLKFKTIGIIHVISGSGKLLVGVILVYINLNIYGAILATLAFSIINFLTSIIPIKNVIKNRSGNVNISINEFGKYAIPTIVSIFALSSFISSDVLLVKHFFNSTEAGLYGGLALVGRVIFYFTGPIALAMFPLIVKRHSMGVKYTGLLYISVALVLIPSTAITIFYFLFPNLTITLFLGGDAYLTISRYLGLYGIFIMIFSINNIFVNFYLSIKKTFVSYLVSATAILQIVLIYIFHDNFYQIIFVSIITSVLLLICLLLYYLLINRSYVVKR